MCIHTYIHTHIYIYIYIYVCVYMYKDIYIYIYTHTHTTQHILYNTYIYFTNHTSASSRCRIARLRHAERAHARVHADDIIQYVA